MKNRLKTNIPIQHVTKFQRIVKDQNGIPVGHESETPESVAKRTAELVAQDVKKILNEKTAASPVAQDVAKTVYYKKGTREFFMVTHHKIIKVLNKKFVSFVTIAHGENESLLKSLIFDGIDGQEITRAEFEVQFREASRLIVLE